MNLMMILTKLDYIYVVAIIIIGLVLITTPRIFMKRVPITEESIKAEDLLKKLGVIFIILAIIMGFVIYFR